METAERSDVHFTTLMEVLPGINWSLLFMSTSCDRDLPSVFPSKQFQGSAAVTARKLQSVSRLN